MKKEEACHYTDTVLYSMEQAIIYFKIKGAQFFNQLNIGVTIDQFATLDAIYSNNDICQRDLCKLILKDRSNTGRILNILEENGFVERVIQTKNNRLVKKVYITEKGKKIIDDNQEKLRSAFSQVFEDVSEEEFDTLREILNKLKESLSKTTSIQI